MANNNIFLEIIVKPGPVDDREAGIINIQNYLTHYLNVDIIVIPSDVVSYFMGISAKYVKFKIIPENYSSNTTQYVMQALYKVSDLRPNEIVNIYNEILGGKMFVNFNGYLSTIQKNLNDFTNVVFPYWCSQKTTTPLYATDPINGKILKEASYFRSSESLGIYCRLWEVNLAAIGVEEAKIGYCKANINSFECACINSKDNTYYKAFNNPDNIPDACWFKPCNLKSSAENFYVYLVPKTEQNPVCPPVSTVTFNETQTLVTKEEANKYFNASKPIPPPTPSFFETYEWWIIGGSILVLFLIAFLIYFIIKKKKNN